MEDQKNYGSNWKKWLWIYIVIGIVVYGAIYFYYSSKSDNNATPGQNNSIY